MNRTDPRDPKQDAFNSLTHVRRLIADLAGALLEGDESAREELAALVKAERAARVEFEKSMKEAA